MLAHGTLMTLIKMEHLSECSFIVAMKSVEKLSQFFIPDTEFPRNQIDLEFNNLAGNQLRSIEHKPSWK